MKKTIQLILELDNKKDVPLGWIKKDLTSQINSAGFYYEIKECMEIEPDKNKNDKLISMMAAIDICRKTKWNGADDYLPMGAREIESEIRALPPAQPELIEQAAYVRGFEQGRIQGKIDAQPDHYGDVTEMDTISRQAAIDEVVAWLKDSMSDKKNGKPLTERLKDLPPAQSEIIRCGECKHRDKRYLCDIWDEYIYNGEYYCGSAERREE